jgi:DNA-binding GntR family transcriptional regulator
MASGRPERIEEIAHERVYATLKSELMGGAFAPGEKMTVRGLAAAHGTSPMPVREALRRLVADQALVQLHNRGIVVPPVSLEHILDLRRVRMAVEGLAAEWAATTIEEDEIQHLAALQRKMRGMVETGDASDYLSCNKAFHFSVYASARSGVLMPVIESLWLQAGPYLTIMRGPATLGMGLDHHDALIAALQRGDGVAARNAIAVDIGEAADVLVRATGKARPRNVAFS